MFILIGRSVHSHGKICSLSLEDLFIIIRRSVHSHGKITKIPSSKTQYVMSFFLQSKESSKQKTHTKVLV